MSNGKTLWGGPEHEAFRMVVRRCLGWRCTKVSCFRKDMERYEVRIYLLPVPVRFKFYCFFVG